MKHKLEKSKSYRANGEIHVGSNVQADKDYIHISKEINIDQDITAKDVYLESERDINLDLTRSSIHAQNMHIKSGGSTRIQGDGSLSEDVDAQVKWLLEPYPDALLLYEDNKGYGTSMMVAKKTINLVVGKGVKTIRGVYASEQTITMTTPSITMNKDIFVARESITFVGLIDVECNGAYIIAPIIHMKGGAIYPEDFAACYLVGHVTGMQSDD